MCMRIHLCYQPKPQMCRIVYSLAKFIYCSKQERSISQCTNVHADPSLLSAQPQMSRIVYSLAKFIYCSKQKMSISQCTNVHADPSLLSAQPQMSRIVYFLAKSVYCSKQYTRMPMLIHIFVVSLTPHMRRLFSFFVRITCQTQHYS